MEEQPEPGRAWHVFATYFAAVAGMSALGGLAFELLRSTYPDVPEANLVRTLPGLLALSLASSSGLLLTLLLVVRPLDAARFRLLPGWETGPTLAVMSLGLLALGQILESLTRIAGIVDRGALRLLREVLQATGGPDLFAAVLVLGVAAGVSEEIFFRGYMQARLREHWSPVAAVLATSTAFGALHLDPAALSVVHMAQALAMGIYLGFVAEISGSTLPAVVCHVVNNIVYTLQTALGVAVVGREANLAAVAIGAVLLGACIWWIRRAAPAPAPV